MIVDEVSVLVTKVLPFFRSDVTELRIMAVNTINSILLVQNEAFVPIIDPFLENLFQLAHDPVEVGDLFRNWTVIYGLGNSKRALSVINSVVGVLRREN